MRSRTLADYADRIAARVEVTETCWIWRGRINDAGYGTYATPAKMKVTRTALAHRLVYLMHVGEIPAGLVLDHLCRNRACVNPDRQTRTRSPHEVQV
jgi:hypothetical protein